MCFVLYSWLFPISWNHTKTVFVTKTWQKLEFVICTKMQNCAHHSDVNLKSYCTHFLYCPVLLCWLDFTALFQPLRVARLSLPRLYEPNYCDPLPLPFLPSHHINNNGLLLKGFENIRILYINVQYIFL